MTLDIHSKIDGFGGLCIEIHQVTLVSGSATTNTKMRNAQKGIAVPASGQSPPDSDNFRVTLSGNAVEVTASSASSALVLDVWIVGY